jgi:hypothetical protein
MKMCALGAAALLLAGCTTTSASAPPSQQTAWKPQVDMKGVSQAQYDKDVGECRAYADANPDANGNKQAGKKALKYGAVGAAAMGAVVVATGGLALLPAAGAALATTGGAAALDGGAVGKVGGDAKYQSIVSGCMSGRGYKVLG